MSLVGSSGPFTQPKTIGSWLEYEVNPQFTRKTALLLAGSDGPRAVVSGQLLGKVTLGTGALTATAGAAVSGGGGTPGNGAVTGLSADPLAKVGEYTVVFIEPEANVGTFQVFDPDGKAAKPATGKVGVAYNGTKGVNFTVGDGAVDWVAGDRIPIVVAAGNTTGNDRYVAYDPAEDNGAQEVAAISLYDAEAPEGEDLEFVILESGPALLNFDELPWPVDISPEDRAAAEAKLISLGIKPTPGAG